MRFTSTALQPALHHYHYRKMKPDSPSLRFLGETAESKLDFSREAGELYNLFDEKTVGMKHDPDGERPLMTIGYTRDFRGNAPSLDEMILLPGQIEIQLNSLNPPKMPDPYSGMLLYGGDSIFPLPDTPPTLFLDKQGKVVLSIDEEKLDDEGLRKRVEAEDPLVVKILERAREFIKFVLDNKNDPRLVDIFATDL